MVVSERARDTGGDQIKLVQQRTRAEWNSVLNRNGAALSDPAITKWLSPRWFTESPSQPNYLLFTYGVDPKSLRGEIYRINNGGVAEQRRAERRERDS